MADWLIRVAGKERKEIDKDLLVQAILALSRQLKRQAAERAALDENKAESSEAGA